MMKRHVLIAGLMGATLLGSITPAAAQLSERGSQRWSQNDRVNRQPQQRAQRPERTQRGPERESARPQRAERQQIERRRIESRVQAAGDRRIERQVVRDDRREWSQNDRDDRRDWRQDRRDDRREWSQNDRDDRRDWRQDRRDDRRDWRQNDRDDRRDWRNDARFRDNDRHYRTAPRYNWNRDWRRNDRYNWQYHRDRYRDRYRYHYYAPRGWNYGYSRFSIGISIWSGLYSSRYWISDPWYYRLPPVHGSLRWVRYYDDALLVDIRTGYVVDVIYDFFW